MEQSSRQSYRLLVVETRLGDLSSINDVFSPQSVQVHAARDLKEAFRILEEITFDLIVAGPGLNPGDCSRLLIKSRRNQPHALTIVCPNRKAAAGRESSPVAQSGVEAFLRWLQEVAEAALSSKDLKEPSPGEARPLQVEERTAGDYMKEGISRSSRNPDVVRNAVPIDERTLSEILHKLRSPLVAIRGYVRMLLQGRAGALNDTQLEYLGIVAANADKLVDSIQQIG